MRGRPRTTLRGPARAHQLAVPATAYEATPTAALISVRGVVVWAYAYQRKATWWFCNDGQAVSLSSVSLSLLRELFPMQTSRNKLRKVCPQCSTPVHVKRAVSECGYAFPSKRKAQSDNMLRAMKHKRVDRLHKANMRASETPEQTVNRQEQDKLCESSMRPSETHGQTVNRQKQSRAHMANMRASETHDQTVNRQEQDKLCKSSMRASETHDQAVNRQKQSRARMASKSRINCVKHEREPLKHLCKYCNDKELIKSACCASEASVCQ